MGTSATYFYSVFAIILGIASEGAHEHTAEPLVLSQPGRLPPHCEHIQSLDQIAASYDAAFPILPDSFILLGKYLEASAKRKTSEAVTKLVNLQPPTALLCDTASAAALSAHGAKSSPAAHETSSVASCISKPQTTLPGDHVGLSPAVAPVTRRVPAMELRADDVVQVSFCHLRPGFRQLSVLDRLSVHRPYPRSAALPWRGRADDLGWLIRAGSEYPPE
eukprot:scaffold67204_cov30-Tisochrysis_lutea.AAC.6